MKTALDERWSYRRANQADFDVAFAALRQRIGAGISTDELGIELQKILSLGIDGHSLVSGYSLPPDTAGLIVDVRGNNGGERTALRLLYSCLAAAGDPPRVFTAAAYRLHPEHKETHLAENHSMYRADAPEWSAKEREAIEEFKRTFKPEWELPQGQFSDWHYMALNRMTIRPFITTKSA